MDYFTSLLESYSKLKKRNLKLLEADEKKKKPKKKASTETEDKGPKQKELTRDEAYTAAWAAPVMDPPSWAVIARVTKKDGTVGEVQAYKAAPKQTKDGGFEAQDADGNVDAQKTVQNKGGYVVAANAVGKNNKATIIDGQGNKTEAFETWYEKNFAGEDQTGAVEGEVDNALTAAEDRAGSQLEAMGLDLSEGLGADLKTELSVLLGRVAKAAQIAREMGVEDTWAQDSSKQPIGSYVTGPTSQSIERKLAKGKTATISKEWGFKTGDLVSEDNVELMAGAMESVNAFAKFSSNEVDSSISDDSCASLSFQVSKYKDKYVFHSHGDMESGIVLPGSDMFKQFEKQVDEICGEGAVQQVPVGVCSIGDENTGRLNEYRGDSLEVTFAAASFYTSIDQMDIPTDKKDDLRKRFGSYARKEILRDGQLFEEAHRWSQELEDSEVATDLDSAFIARAISDLGELTNTPEKVHRFLSQAFAMERAVIEQIKPDMSIPVGEETGTGIVDDLKYVYLGNGAERRATEVAAQLNLTGDNTVETTTMGELKKLNPAVAGIYQDGYGLSDNTVVYSVGSSIKAYLDEANSTAGQIKNYWRRSAIILGTESEQIAPGFRKLTAERLGFNDTDIREVQSYQKKLDDTYKTLDSVLPSNATVMKTADGLVSQITFDTVRPILEEVVGKLPKKSHVRQRIEKLFGSDGNINLSDDRARRNFKEELSRTLINYQQQSDSTLRGKDGKLTQKARQSRKHLAYTVHMVGGVMRDSALNKKVLKPKTGDPSVIVTSHMQPLMEATLGFTDFDADDQAVDDYKKDPKGRNPRSDWGVSLWGSTTLRIEGPAGKYISLGTKRKKLAKGRTQTETSVNVGAEAAKASASIDETIPEWKETSPRVEREDNSLLVNFLKGQAQLLEQLLSNQ